MRVSIPPTPCDVIPDPNAVRQLGLCWSGITVHTRIILPLLHEIRLLYIQKTLLRIGSALAFQCKFLTKQCEKIQF